jgi:integrase
MARDCESKCLRLQVKDLDFERGRIIVREGKGGKDRVTVLPEKQKVELEQHLMRVKLLPAKGDEGSGASGQAAQARSNVGRLFSIGVARSSLCKAWP